jgi:hypothetical protein
MFVQQMSVKSVIGPSIVNVVSTSQLGKAINLALMVYKPASKFGIVMFAPVVTLMD